MTATSTVDRGALYRSLARNSSFRVTAPFTKFEGAGADLTKALVPEGTTVLKEYNALHAQPTKRAFHAYISTEVQDRLREVILQKGLDFDEFMRWGWFNDNHIQKTGAILGYPLYLALQNHPTHGLRWYCKGCLLDDPEGVVLERVQEIYHLMLSLQGNPTRSLGTSIEGTTLIKQGAKIVKAIVRNVAVTPYSVNAGCPLELLLDAMEGTEEYMRSLTAEHPITSIGGGGVLHISEVRGSQVVEVYQCTATGQIFPSEGALVQYQERNGIRPAGTVRKGQVLDKSSAILHIMKENGYTEDVALDIYEWVKQNSTT